MLGYLVVGKNSRGGWFPDGGVSRHGRSRWQIPPNGSEIKGSDGKDKSLQGTIFHAIEDSLYRLGLLFYDLSHKITAKPEKIHEFTYGLSF